MKVALCFIISYQHIVHKEQLWIDWIRPNEDIINVYFHYSDLKAIRSPWIKSHTLPPSIVQNTSYYNVVPAYMSVLSYAFEHDKKNVWFCLLTESCVPILSPAAFRQRFFEHYRTSIIGCRPSYWNITLHRRANLRLLSKEYWLANDPWFTLCRNHVHKCLLFMALKTPIYQQINAGGLANESLFAIVLQTFDELEEPHPRLLNASSTVADWTRMSSPTSPYLFKEATPENVDRIRQLLEENKHAMFLRKVHKDFPDAVLHKIMGFVAADDGKDKQRGGQLINAFLVAIIAFFWAVLWFL